MRVAIPSDDQLNVAGHTGRCGGFMILDVTDEGAKRVEYRSNSYTQHATQHMPGATQQQGKGGHSHNRLLDAIGDCQAIVALGMGPRLVNDLDAAGIQVFFSRETNIDKIGELMASGSFKSDPNGSACQHAKC